MNLWILLFSLLLSPVDTARDIASGDVELDAQPLRYRGIDQLLAKFDAQAVTHPTL